MQEVNGGALFCVSVFTFYDRMDGHVATRPEQAFTSMGLTVGHKPSDSGPPCVIIQEKYDTAFRLSILARE